MGFTEIRFHFRDYSAARWVMLKRKVDDKRNQHMFDSVTNEQVREHYGDNISEISSICPGGFLNIGYWHGIALDGALSVEDRVSSERALYRKALNYLDITSTDRLLEIGCGLGRGSAFALDEFGPAEVHGVDLLPIQVERAQAANAEVVERSKGRLVYQLGSATALPYPDGYFDKIVSVEAIQHFPDLDGFVAEVARVTRASAQIVIAAVLAPTSDVTLDQWLHLISPSIPEGLYFAHAAPTLVDIFIANGFTDVDVVSIGEYVWPGFDMWLEQSGFEKGSQARNWPVAYDQGLLDYYVVTATVHG